MTISLQRIHLIIFCLILILFSTIGRAEDTPGIFLPNQWTLRPAGVSIPLGDFPINSVISPDGHYLAVLHCGYSSHEIRIINIQDHSTVSAVTVVNLWRGIQFSSDGKYLYASSGADDSLYRWSFNEGNLSSQISWDLRTIPDCPKILYPCGIAIDNKNQFAYIAATYGNRILKLNLQNPKSSPTVLSVLESYNPHAYPYDIVLDSRTNNLYISLWGDKSLLKINLKDPSTKFIHTGSHPNELVLNKDGKRLFVACANSNTVDIVDTQTNKVTERLNSSLYPHIPAGSTPNGIAISPNEKTLLIANADNNNLAVFDISKPGEAASQGYIPTEWYPTGVHFDSQGNILVINGKGGKSLPNPQGPDPVHRTKTDEYIAGLLKGSLSFIAAPDKAQLKEYTRKAYLCSPLREDLLPVHPEANNPIPAQIGDSSPIKYCVYIIKENRTYDQVLGDITTGNGDPNLCIFPEKVTPNHHALVNEFVLLDNFYVESQVSASGHEWTMGAYATDFVAKNWPPSYGGHTKGKIGYKSEGTDPVNDSDAGHLWNKAQEAGITYRSYGEWIRNAGPEGNGKTNDKALKGHFNPYYPGFNLDISDFDRIKVFQSEFATFVDKGTMPQLTIIRLPNDHTHGATKGKKTPISYLAENDLALGMLIDTLSHSPFWKEMAVFIVEDDAQNGSDHVDAHRTVGMVVSPYIKRGQVNHKIYSTASMLRTMELILGLQPMSQFDAAALPMYACFTTQPDTRPYTFKPAQVSLTNKNKPKSPMQKESSRLRFDKEDSNPDILFNEIIWKAVKGADSIMPPPVRAAFVFPQPKPDND